MLHLEFWKFCFYWIVSEIKVGMGYFMLSGSNIDGFLKKKSVLKMNENNFF